MGADRYEPRPDIIFLLPELRIGGAQKVFLSLMHYFQRTGLWVELILLLEEGELISEIPEGMQVTILCPSKRLNPVTVIKAFLCLRQYLRIKKPRALLSTLTKTNLLAAAALPTGNTEIKLITRESATLENIPQKTYRSLIKLCYRRVFKVIVLTEKMADQYRHLLNTSDAKITVIPNPVNLSQIAVLADESLPPDSPPPKTYILAVGRLFPQKDYRTLLRAFALVKKSHPDMQLVIIGEGPERNSLEDFSRELGIEDSVHLKGYDKNPLRWMKQAQALVISSRWEGYPNVLIEGLALKIPAISTEFDSYLKTDPLFHSVTTVPIGNFEALAAGIKQVVASDYTLSDLILPTVESVAVQYLNAMGLKE